MKRLLITALMSIMPVIAIAQGSLPSSAKANDKKQLKKNDVEAVTQRIVNIGVSVSRNVQLDYVVGKRINHWVFMGGGFGFRSELKPAEASLRKHMNDNLYLYASGDYSIDRNELYSKLKSSPCNKPVTLNTFGVPVFANVRTYLSESDTCPFISLSIGGRFAPDDSGFYLDVSGGADIKFSPVHRVAVSVGFWISPYRNLYLESYYYDDPDYGVTHNYSTKITRYEPYEICDKGCEFSGSEQGHSHVRFYNFFKNKTVITGFTVKISMSTLSE